MLLHASNVSKLFAADIVLSGVDLRIDRREKVALVGRNGCGKTTFLKILTGEYEPDGGSIQWERGASVGYLSQHSRLDPAKTVLGEAEDARKHLVAMERRLEELARKLETESSEEDLEEFALLHEHFHSEGGYSVERDLRIVLARMGFAEQDLDKPVAKLSGGETTRLTLAKLLLEEPDLLILDEPTNHLDLDATEWLESWIRGYHGAVLVVSHDRTFLQNVAQRVVEMRNGTTKSYPCGYNKYLELRQEEEDRLAEVAKRQQEEIAKLDEFVRRFMNSQRTAQARGRLKQMEKLQAAAIQAPKAEKGLAAGFGKVKRAGDIVFEAKRLAARFGERTLFENLDWTVRWGERWGVVGQNGAGKSTLMKILLGQIQPSEGRCRHGANVEPGYFAQDANTLNMDLSPMLLLNDELGMELGPARSLLGRFLISGEDATRPIKTLSGGERNKMQLAVLTAINPNVLILDEPTNHLDMDSREALAQVLHEYTGTLILVSHDRWLLDQTTDHTIDIRGGQARQFSGSFGEYRAWQRRGKPAEAVPPQAPSTSWTPKQVHHATNSAGVGAVFRTPGSTEVPEPRLTPRELSKLISQTQKAVTEAEERVTRLESELESLERTMAQPPPDANLFALSARHGELQQEIAASMADWESLSLELETLKGLQSSPSPT